MKKNVDILFYLHIIISQDIDIKLRCIHLKLSYHQLRMLYWGFRDHIQFQELLHGNVHNITIDMINKWIKFSNFLIVLYASFYEFPFYKFLNDVKNIKFKIMKLWRGKINTIYPIGKSFLGIHYVGETYLYNKYKENCGLICYKIKNQKLEEFRHGELLVLRVQRK